MRALWVLGLLVLVGLSGCLNGNDDGSDGNPLTGDAPAPFLGYLPVEPDMALDLLMEDLLLPGSSGNNLHVRITRPVGDGPFPAIVQDTPYTGTGCVAATYDGAFEPPVVGCAEGTFETQFARRGYAYVHGDLRGTGDSDGCLDLRGQADIADIGALADALAALPWNNGNVGFIGASYPGSTSHMAALSGSDAVKAVVPVVASTSFYHYHHNSGVPYNGNHALGGTNTGYTSEGVTPTVNPASGLQKLIDQPLCPHVENAIEHGGLDQSGSYYAWWQERNLRPLAEKVTVPVLMAQGLADWNVKPDHVATWFNDIPTENKVFIGGQWGHAYPASGDGACGNVPEEDREGCIVPWDGWWAYAAAFFDTYLKEIDTGMFEGTLAWVQDNNRTWHRSSTWPLPVTETVTMKFAGSDLVEPSSPFGTGVVYWYGCPDDQFNRGTALSVVESLTVACSTRSDQTWTLVSEPLEQDLLVSGIPLVHMTLLTEGRNPHLTVVMDILDASGNVVTARENYGYLNPLMRNGIDAPEAIPNDWFNVTVDLYPQEDLIPAGHRIRLTLGSDDGGRTIESYDEGVVRLDAGHLELPIRPAHLWGTRLA